MGESRRLAPILVTGAHRTGTTWVGKMLAASGETAYISEPLNVWRRPGVLRVPVRHWYTYICPENEALFYAGFQETFGFQYHLLAEIRSLRSRKDLMRMGRDWSIFLRGRFSHQRPLLKDPFAVFSIPWFIRRFGCQVVVTVRHPAAFASSLKRLNWSFDFRDLLDQPLLVQDLLNPYQAELEAMCDNSECPTEGWGVEGSAWNSHSAPNSRSAPNSCSADIIRQASLLWSIIYQAVARYQKQFPQIIVVRHEDLSLDPVDGFQALYDSIDLNFNNRARKKILNSSSSENPHELDRKAVHSVRLNSRANLHNWKRRLEVDEIRCIRDLTENVTAEFYPDLNWE